MNERTKEIDKFLKQITKLYMDNPNLSINADTIYSFLVSSGKEKKTIKQYHEGWIEYFKNTPNIDVYEWDRDNGYFCEFENLGINREYTDHIKLYIPVSSENIDKIAKDLFTYLASKNIYHQSKIGSIERRDDIVVRLENATDIKIVEEYVNNNPDIKKSSIDKIPFNFTSEYISYAMDGHTSYNVLVCSYIKSYLENKKRNNLLNLKSVSYEDFKNYSTAIYENCFGENYTRENYNWFISTFECARYVLKEPFNTQFQNLSNCSNILINALNTNDLNVFYDIVKKNQKNAINVKDVVKACFAEMVNTYGVEKAKINFEQYIKTHNENYIPIPYLNAIKIIESSALKKEYDSIKGSYKAKDNYEVVKECFNYMINKYKEEGYIGFVNRINTYLTTNNINLFSREYRSSIQGMGKEEFIRNVNKVREEYVKNNNMNTKPNSNVIDDLYKSIIDRTNSLGIKCDIKNANGKIEIYVGSYSMFLKLYNDSLLFTLNDGEKDKTIGYDINPTNIDIILSRCLNVISNENLNKEKSNNNSTNVIGKMTNNVDANINNTKTKPNGIGGLYNSIIDRVKNNTKVKPNSNVIDDLYKSLLDRINSLGIKCDIKNTNGKVEIYVGNKYIALMLYDNKVLFNVNDGERDIAKGYNINSINLDNILSSCVDIISNENLNKEKSNNNSIDVTSTLVNSIDTTVKKHNTNLDDKTLKYLRVDAIRKIMPDMLNDNYNKITRELDARFNLEAIGSNAISVDLIKACIINKTAKFSYKSSFSKEEIDNTISNVLYQVENGNVENALLFLKDSKIQQILIENYAYTSSYTTKEQRDIIYKSSNIKNKDLLVSTQNEYMLNNQKTY